MKFHCIADEDTVRGFRLAGVTGSVVRGPAEAAAAVRSAVGQADCGILIMTHETADGIRALVEEVRQERERPLIVEITGLGGGEAPRKSLRELVQEAVGIHLDSEKGG